METSNNVFQLQTLERGNFLFLQENQKKSKDPFLEFGTLPFPSFIQN
ncbi:hypothetical protein LEP1GSC062_3353 [Leptospira alexanderi serovar Manhao 3 str. L 60]|uniref:Uncharacterized protein n=1 Tax=Leptospira alexanderi serovar Manhao 3 str. L 60 TaxID=1049759 RepID=V6I7G5_9LEPT|nr:hypothetical protein LEP1GSC062_3353 [Leptospira alexanderi serovar Manhao 3 str. L 60]